MSNRIITLSDLPLSKEKTLFWVLAVFSSIFWLVALIGIFVTAPICLLLFFVNGLFIARIKSESVEVTAKQMPELHQIFLNACKKVELETAPRLFIMQSGGWLNAFATRFARRNFVVLYSDLVESLETNSKELQFIIGHELGHIKQKHLTTGIFVLPGMVLPLLGPAYSRARESTCDRYGAFVAEDNLASMRAVLALAGGKKLYRVMDPLAFADQHQSQRGFFISLHELISTYPTLSKRVADVSDFGSMVPAKKATKNPFAYGFALFSLSPGMIVLIYIGFFASVLGNVALKTLRAKDTPVVPSEKTTESIQGLWYAEDEGYFIEFSENTMRVRVLCEDDTEISASSKVLYGDQFIEIARSDFQEKTVLGESCSAMISEGRFPIMLIKDSLVLGQDDESLKLQRVKI